MEVIATSDSLGPQMSQLGVCVVSVQRMRVWSEGGSA